jgi:hypothetical protein
MDLIDCRFVCAAFIHRDFSGTSLACMALSKKRLAAVLARFAVNRKSTMRRNRCQDITIMPIIAKHIRTFTYRALKCGSHTPYE